MMLNNQYHEELLKNQEVESIVENASLKKKKFFFSRGIGYS